MKSISLRQKKLSEQIKRFVSRVIMLDLAIEKRIKNMLTITKVQITTDLRIAKVFVLIGNEDRRVCILVKDFLNDLAPQIRFAIGKELCIKFTPDIKFVLDTCEQLVNDSDIFLDYYSEPIESLLIR